MNNPIIDAGEKSPLQWGRLIQSLWLSEHKQATDCDCGSAAGCPICMPKNYPSPIEIYPTPQQGWQCPVCHKGNAPFALKCGHCKG